MARPVRSTLALLLCALAGSARAPAAPVGAGPDAAPVEEIVVGGERPGPQLWRVTNGDHTLWLLGLLQPLPERMRWRSEAVEQVLGEAQEVIASGGEVSARLGLISGLRLYRQWRALRRNPDGASLAERLPAPLWARFDALRLRYARRDRSIDELRPIFAAARLFEAATRRIGLDTENDVQAAVLKMARKRDLPIRRVHITLSDPARTLAALGEIPLEREIACLETTIARLETDLGAMRARALAWADGDVEAFRAAPYVDQEAACWQALGSSDEIRPLIESARAQWLELARAALASSRVSLAMESLDRILAEDGTLAKLRAAGYEVRGP